MDLKKAQTLCLLILNLHYLPMEVYMYFRKDDALLDVRFNL